MLPSSEYETPSGGIIRDRVRKPDREHKRLAVQRGSVADALDLEIALVAVGHADNHVVQQRPSQPVRGAMLSLVVRPLDAGSCRCLAPTHTWAKPLRQRSPWPVNRDRIVVANVDLDRRPGFAPANFQFVTLPFSPRCDPGTSAPAQCARRRCRAPRRRYPAVGPRNQSELLEACSRWRCPVRCGPAGCLLCLRKPANRVCSRA